MSAETQTKQKPVAEIREGKIKIAIWERNGTKGTFYTAGKPQLSYKDDEGKWHNDASSYDGFDLIDLGTAALNARAKIRELGYAVKEANNDQGEDE